MPGAYRLFADLLALAHLEMFQEDLEFVLIVFLEPNMMIGILLYGFAGALLGGLNSPGGAVLGGFLVGVMEVMVGTYVPIIGNELKVTVALVLIVGVLVFKPSGLFGRPVVRRV